MSNSSSHERRPSRTYRSVVDFDDEEELLEALVNPSLWSRDDCGNDDLLAAAADIMLDDSWDWTLTNFDNVPVCAPPQWESQSNPQSVQEEAKRLLNVKTFDMIGRVDDATLQQTQESLNTLARMGQRLFDVPICQINLVDLGQVYSVSEVGCNGVIEFERRHTFCTHTIQFKEDIMEVTNATGDSRFCQNPHVQGDFHLRYYAGTQLISPEGYRIGTFCIVGCEPKPHPMNEEQKETLKDLARLAAQALASRRDLATARKSLHETERAVQAGAHDMNDLLTTTQFAIEQLNATSPSQAKDQRVQSAATAVTMVKEISQSTLLKVQEEAAKALPNAFDHMTKTLLSETSDSEETDNKDKSFRMNIKQCLHNLLNLIEPFPKPTNIVFAADSQLPTDLLIAGTPQQLVRACLNLLFFACHRANHRQHQPQRAPSIQLHVLRRNKHVVFECHHDKGADNEDDDAETQRLQRLFEIITRQGNTCSREQSVNADDKAILQHYGMWPLTAHVKDLSGLYGYSPTSPTGHPQQCITWFALPLVEAPPEKVIASPQQQQQQQQHIQYHQQKQEQQNLPQLQLQEQQLEQQPITPTKYNVHALEAVLKTLQTMIQPIVRAHEEEEQQRQHHQQQGNQHPVLIEFRPTETLVSRSNSQSTVGSMHHPLGRSNSHSTVGSQLSVPQSSSGNYVFPRESKRAKLSNGLYSNL